MGRERYGDGVHDAFGRVVLDPDLQVQNRRIMPDRRPDDRAGDGSKSVTPAVAGGLDSN